MLSKTMQDAINEQIQKEYHSSYLYLAMSAYCEASNLPVRPNGMRVQSQEELSHAMKLYDTWWTAVAAYAAGHPAAAGGVQVGAGRLREGVGPRAARDGLHPQAVRPGPQGERLPAQIMLQWFVSEQVEEEKNAGQVVEQLKAGRREQDLPDAAGSAPGQARRRVAASRLLKKAHLLGPILRMGTRAPGTHRDDGWGAAT